MQMSASTPGCTAPSPVHPLWALNLCSSTRADNGAQTLLVLSGLQVDAGGSGHEMFES